jgi:hypothetical protein
MKGFIYCFTTHENPYIIKAGHTHQEVSKRMRGYLGPTKPRTMIFTHEVDDSVEAEKMMLKLMRQTVSIKQREDLGNEWFETVGEYSFHDRQVHLENIAQIVKKASKKQDVVYSGESDEISAEESDEKKVKRLKLTNFTEKYGNATTLRGLEYYFETMDQFVREEAPPFEKAVDLLRAYEASKFSPYGKFCQFLRFPEEVRVQVTANRYSEFLSKT